MPRLRVVPRLAYNDPTAAVAFLDRAFGFAEDRAARLEHPEGSVYLTQIVVAGVSVMIGTAGGHGLASPATAGTTTQALIVYVDDLDGHCRRARAAGAEVVSEPADQFWGERRYEAKDLEGHLWSFHQPVRAVPVDEIRRRFHEVAGES